MARHTRKATLAAVLARMNDPKFERSGKMRVTKVGRETVYTRDESNPEVDRTPYGEPD
jgi:hypothetical protein